MKISLPDPQEFDLEMLAERWDCSVSLILCYVNDGILDIKTAFPSIFEFDPNTGKEEFLKNYVRYYFTLAEVWRFEAENSPDQDTAFPGSVPVAQSMNLETMRTYIDQERANGVTDRDIALELLKRKNEKGKNISKEMVGRVLHPNHESITSPSAFTHYITKMVK